MTCEIFGIVNVTPDSFSDGGNFFTPKKSIEHAYSLFRDGADFIDIGGESTRPNAEEVSTEEEWGRVEPVLIEFLQNPELRPKISLDTRNPEVARKFFDLGGEILNDVSGLCNKKMKELVAQCAKTIIIGHWSGEKVNEVHEQEIDSVFQVRDELLVRFTELLHMGVSPDRIVLDPTIGFGKTMECNRELLKFAELVPEHQVMIGHSRKRFLGEHRFEVEPNVKAAEIAINSGARYLRVHDVLEHNQLLNNC